MINKKKPSKLILKLIIFILFVVILIALIFNIIARFESKATSVGEIETAFYMLNEDYKTMNLNLPEIVPSDTAYTYNFSISNNDGNNRTEVDLEYTLEIYATTNLPLTYELYLNQSYTDSGAASIITSNTVEADEYGTYFRKISTDSKRFGYVRNETNIYQIVIYFPEIYKSIEYQDIIESIEIKVNSKQIIE